MRMHFRFKLYVLLVVHAVWTLAEEGLDGDKEFTTHLSANDFQDFIEERGVRVVYAFRSADDIEADELIGKRSKFPLVYMS